MNDKKNLLLIVPMLHQGGFERVCVQTARLLEPYYHVSILIFSSKDINYDITGLDVIDIDLPGGKKGKLGKSEPSRRGNGRCACLKSNSRRKN